MDDLHRIDPGAIFEPDRPSAATASMPHMGQADLAIGPEGEPVRELLTRVEPMPKPPPSPSPLGNFDAGEHSDFIALDGIPRREAEPIARQVVAWCNSPPRRVPVWETGDARDRGGARRPLQERVVRYV
jgi:hypothetical protein